MRINSFSTISLATFFALFSIVYAKSTTFFVLFDICKNDTIKIKDYGIQRIEPPAYSGISGGNYSIVFISTKEETVLKHDFDVTFLIHGIEVDSETGETKPKEVKLECAEIYLRLPFFDNTKRIRYMHYDKIIYEKDICNFNKLCEADKGENILNCPEDCGGKPNCGNKICEIGETQENCCKDCGCPSGYTCIENKCVKVLSPIVYFIILLIISTLIVVIILLSKRSSQLAL